jgi:hypothetical protein
VLGRKNLLIPALPERSSQAIFACFFLCSSFCFLSKKRVELIMHFRFPPRDKVALYSNQVVEITSTSGMSKSNSFLKCARK